MNKLALVIFAVVCAVASSLPVDNAMSGLAELPCLNKLVGQRLPHPTDKHKFMRCVSADTLWIETCPDGLVYNIQQELCDWTVVSKTTTRINEVVKHRPVLFKAGKIIPSMTVDDTDVPITMASGSRRQLVQPVVDTPTIRSMDSIVDTVDPIDTEVVKKPSRKSFIPLADMERD